MGGIVFYEGPSALDGAPIVAIATTGSTNIKTGPMVQTWILRADRSPLSAIATGADVSVCGLCPHRGVGARRTCYVDVGKAPEGIWRAWQRGRYGPECRTGLAELVRKDAERARSMGRGSGLRMGAYGDPAAVPADAWGDAPRIAETRTGYTHQWHLPVAQWLRRWAMASVDTGAEKMLAEGMGWRTFQVLPVAVDISALAGSMRRTVECLNTSHGLQCIDCGACGGIDGGSARLASIAIGAHGAARNFVRGGS